MNGLLGLTQTSLEEMSVEHEDDGMNTTGIFDAQIENLKLMETKSNRLNLRNRTQFVKMTASGAQLFDTKNNLLNENAATY